MRVSLPLDIFRPLAEEQHMSRIKVGIACQGGGSQTAFTAGALKTLIDSGVNKECEPVSISGTSGGAVCAALAWYAFRKGELPRWNRLIDFWKDNIAHGWSEQMFNDFIIDAMRLVNKGAFPTFQLSPSSPFVQTMMSFLTLGSRRHFTDFPELLRKYIDFDEVARWGPSTDRPTLVIGAANVTTGRLTKFVSSREAIRLEHILASCCVPNIFPAVDIDGEAYWDGLFSDNPPVEELARPRSVGVGNIPEEIWLIKINPTARKRVPLEPDDILDRRNQIEGNISLFHQLDHLEMINDLILDGAFKPGFLDQLDVRTAIRIPKSFATDPDKPYHIPCIEMPQEVQDTLDCEGKIDRSARNIEWLLEQGEEAGKRFLRERAKVVAAHSMPRPGTTHLLRAQPRIKRTA
jgi:NTE family protein